MNDHSSPDVTSADPETIGELGARLESRAVNFGNRAAQVLAKFAVEPEAGASPHRPYAADPRNEPAQPIVERHEAAIEAARELMSSLGSGMAAVGSTTTSVGRELADRDARLADEHRDIDQTGHGR